VQCSDCTLALSESRCLAGTAAGITSCIAQPILARDWHAIRIGVADGS
jgi:hypothetical protein